MIMVRRTLVRVTGSALLIDGVATLVFGNAYVRRWRIGSRHNRFDRAIDWLSGRPGLLIRAAGALEAGIGIGVLGRSPLQYDCFYRAIAGSYDTVLDVWYDRLYPDADETLRTTLATHLPHGGRVLDLGCGTGANLERLVALDVPFASYIGVDQSAAMLRQARAKFAAQDRVAFRQADLVTDTLPAGPFDLIVSTWVFEHLQDPAQVVRKAWEVLRPGGHIVLLYEVTGATWSSRLVGWVWRWFDARLLREDEVEGFPGVATVLPVAGLGAPVVLVVLEKPQLADRP
jgi:SAM-dependent methyltransferase